MVRPAGADETFLTAVSCSSVRRCTAVGSFQLTTSPIGPYPLAERWTGSRWRQQVTPGKGEWSIGAFAGDVASGDLSLIRAGPRESLDSHLMACAAERSRQTGAPRRLADEAACYA